MKKILLLFLILNTHFCLSQSQDLPIKFKANEEANVWIGKEWSYEFEKMTKPLNVEFDGQILKIYYDSGKVYLQENVLSFQRKEKRNYDKLEDEAYILKIEEGGFIQYIVIEKSYLFSDRVIPIIKIPFVSDTGEVMSYWYYQEW